MNPDNNITVVNMVKSYTCANWGTESYLPRTKTPQLSLSLNPALTDTQADEECGIHCPQSLLDKLNSLTGYDLCLEEPNLNRGLERLILQNHDIGIAYAWFRTAFVFIPPDLEVTVSTSQHFGNSSGSGAGDSILEWTVRYCGLPDLYTCDESLTTALAPLPDALDQRIAKIHSQSNLRISNPGQSHPRRLWDLLANRVVPYDWHARESRALKSQLPKQNDFVALQSQASYLKEDFETGVQYTALSHSWDQKPRRILTPVNHRQWPIPLPSEMTIDKIREELLWLHRGFGELQASINARTGRRIIGTEYFWLDILCLRQAWCEPDGTLLPISGEMSSGTDAGLAGVTSHEEKRVEEWRLDVPTIGGIYRRATMVLIYLNGIGRVVGSYSRSKPTHWSNRVWTLQEWVEARERERGRERGVPLFMGIPNSRNLTQQAFWKMQKRLGMMVFSYKANVGVYRIRRFVRNGVDFKEILRTLVGRNCTSEVDRIAGFLHFFDRHALPCLPVYDYTNTPEEAWNIFIESLTNPWKWELATTLGMLPHRLFCSWADVMLWKIHRFCVACSPGFCLQEHPTALSPVPDVRRLAVEHIVLQPLIGPMAFPCIIGPGDSEDKGPVRMYWKSSNPESSSDESETNTLQKEAWVSPDALSGEYYLVPQIGPSMEEVARSRASEYLWVGPAQHESGAGWYQDIRFLVCTPRHGGTNGWAEKWDGVSFGKVGTARLRIEGCDPDTARQYLQETQFGRMFEQACLGLGRWEEILLDIMTLSVLDMERKYRKRPVYSLIYESDGPAAVPGWYCNLW